MVQSNPHALLAAWELARRQPPLDRAVTLLAYVTGETRDLAARIDVGSRDVLLARVLTSWTGSSLDACARCRCGTRLDVAVDLATIARWPTHPVGSTVSAAIGGRTVVVSMPTTADLQALQGLDPDEARRRLVERCAGVGSDPEVDSAIDSALDEASPATVVGMLLSCPSCGAEWEAALDLPALFWAEVEHRAQTVLRQVHDLACAYGWSESEILALSAARRASYLDLVSA